jgi:nitronate monooxygenase
VARRDHAGACSSVLALTSEIASRHNRPAALGVATVVDEPMCGATNRKTMAGSVSTRVCELLGIEHPIILAGMSPVARAPLAAAVSAAGGLGVIGGAGMSLDMLRSQIREVREHTDKPFGIDLLLPNATATLADLRQPAREGREAGGLPQEYLDFQQRAAEELEIPVKPFQPGAGAGGGGGLGSELVERQIDLMIEEGVPVFASGLGNPAPYADKLHHAGMVIMALVGNTKNARRVAEGGADIVVAQGTEAGGHTGRIGTMALIPQVVDAVAPIPVVAAGGIADGRGLAAAIALGAEGVWCGTAFLASPEATLDEELKDRVVDANDEDTRITRLYSGKTMRNINNPLIDLWESSGLQALPMGAQGAVSEPIQRAAREAGRIDLIRNAGGQAAGMVAAKRPAGEIVREMAAQAAEVLSQLPVRTSMADTVRTS